MGGGMMEWQPIETAPKDGTFVTAAAESKTFFRFPYPMKQRWNEEKGKWEANDGHTYDPQPTHWMPLPKPPK